MESSVVDYLLRDSVLMSTHIFFFFSHLKLRIIKPKSNSVAKSFPLLQKPTSLISYFFLQMCFSRTYFSWLQGRQSAEKGKGHGVKSEGVLPILRNYGSVYLKC